MSEIQGIARLRIHVGKLEDFKRLAANCLEVARSQELRNAAVRLVHQRRLLGPFRLRTLSRLRGPAGTHRQSWGDDDCAGPDLFRRDGDVLGTPSAPLRKALDAAGGRIYAPFQSL
jgi:hypothetical protein